jgi:hypothetical protein
MVPKNNPPEDLETSGGFASRIIDYSTSILISFGLASGEIQCFLFVIKTGSPTQWVSFPKILSWFELKTANLES